MTLPSPKSERAASVPVLSVEIDVIPTFPIHKPNIKTTSVSSKFVFPDESFLEESNNYSRF